MRPSEAEARAIVLKQAGHDRMYSESNQTEAEPSMWSKVEGAPEYKRDQVRACALRANGPHPDKETR